MIKYMKYFIYLFVFIAFFPAKAGSYEDYFVMFIYESYSPVSRGECCYLFTIFDELHSYTFSKVIIFVLDKLMLG